MSRFSQLVALDPQYSVEKRYREEDEAEKRLMFAILEDAIRCFQGDTPEPRMKAQAFKEAEFWLLDDLSHQTFSFRNVCESLGINPNFLREGLRAWKAAGHRLESQKSFEAELSGEARRRIIADPTRGIPSGRNPQTRTLS